MNATLQHIQSNWKSTVSSILTVLIAVGLYLTTVPNSVVSAPVAAGITTFIGIAKIVLGFIQNDAKPSATSSVTIESTSPIVVPPVPVAPPTEKP